MRRRHPAALPCVFQSSLLTENGVHAEPPRCDVRETVRARRRTVDNGHGRKLGQDGRHKRRVRIVTAAAH
jgi:hypothetical protein